MIFGVANFYDITRQIELREGENLTQFGEKRTKQESTKFEDNHKSFDLVCRLEGGFSGCIGGDFFIYPNAKIDYLHVLEQGGSERVDEETNVNIDALHESFLRSQVALKFTWEYFSKGVGCFIPSVSVGWQRFMPLTMNAYHYELDGCEKGYDAEVKIKPWNYSYLAAGLSIVDKRAILVSINYELSLGQNSAIHAWNCRVALSW